MAISIGDAVLKLGVDKGNFERDMKGIAGSIQKHRKAIGIGMTAMGTAIVGGLALVVTSFAKTGDEIQKMAIRTGFATETLSEYKFMAELGGASLTDLEKAVKRMSGTILDAQDGMETYVRAFQHLGIEVAELEGLNPEEQFEKIALAIAAVEDPTRRAALAQDIFGRAGTALIPIFDQGVEGMEAMKVKAKELGIIFDQEAADSAAEFNDSLTTLKGSFDGIKMIIAKTLIPIITKLVQKITPIIQKIKDWIKEHPKLSRVILAVVAIIGGLMLVLGPLLIILPSLVTGIGLLGGAFAFLMGPVGLVIAAIAAVIAIGVLLWKNWQKIKDWAVKIWTNIKEFFIGIWQKITGIFKANWDKILAILFPVVGIPILIARNWNKIKDFFLSIWNKIKEIFINAWKWVFDHTIQPLLDTKDWIVDKWQKIADFFKGLWANIKEIFASAINWIIDRINTLISWINMIPGVDIGEIGHIGGVSAPVGISATQPNMSNLQASSLAIPPDILAASGFNTADITIMLDSKMIGHAVGQPLVEEIRVKTGVRQ